MLSKICLLLLLILFYFELIQSTESGCEFNSTTYPINSEWTLPKSCQICRCLSNKLVICRNQTCQIPKYCGMDEQLTLKAGSCCPVCSTIRHSCLYESTAIRHNTIFYPKECLQCRCRDGRLFCSDICHQSIVQNQCLFQNEIYQVNSIWSPLPCVICQCTEIPQNRTASAICYIKQCPMIKNCHGSVEFIPGQCCPVCQTNICRERNGLIYQNNDVWTGKNNCTHCTCRNGEIQCIEEVCPVLNCRSNEKMIRLPNICCPICSNRSVCRYYGSKGYHIYYENDLWYTSACQYCTCRRHNRIICKSIQCEHQFCLDDEIQEARTDTCCVSCRQPKQCHLNDHTLKERSYHQVDNCTLCTCTSEHQHECYSNCNHNGYSISHLKASNLHRNHTITVTDSSATILAYSKFGRIVSSSNTRSLLFQFSSNIIKSNAAVLLGIIHNKTGEISYRLVLIDFNITTNYYDNNTIMNQNYSDELRFWMPLNVPTQSKIKTTTTYLIVRNDKATEQIILIILVIILSFICVVLILIVIFLCYRRRNQTSETDMNTSTLKQQSSSLSLAEKFHTPDLTTKVTLLAHFHVMEHDYGTDV